MENSLWTNIVVLHQYRKMHMSEMYQAFSRKKRIDSTSESSLARCLSTLDLTALGIGSTLGVGVYVTAGLVANDTAGPAVVLSFAIAAIASMIAGLCYAEFGARVPKAGSAYVYTYVTMGEFLAFVIGWTLILEYVIGSASVVRGLSTYVDALFNNSMRNAFENAAPINVSHLSSYPDFFAFSVTVAFSIAVAFGAKESSMANNIFTMVNLSVVLFVVVAGAFKANFGNWNLPPKVITNSKSERVQTSGGFMPYGLSGVIKGAATCFYAFIGFDCVATTSEEAKNPQKSIPIAIVASLTVVFLAYVGVSTILTTVLPFYAQDPEAPFPHMFRVIGWDWARYVVTAGAICALCASLLGSLFPLPRIIYAMASDGLIFKWMGKVSSRFQTPFMGTLSAGLLTGLLAAIFELKQLVDMMSIGTLLAYSIVAACVLILRYEESQSFEKRDDREVYSITSIFRQLINYKRLTYSTRLTSKLVSYLVFAYFIVCVCLTSMISAYSTEIRNGNVLFLVPLVTFTALLGLILFFIYLQPICDKQLSFSVPLVPLIPGISILINVYLMMMLDIMTWVRFGIWNVVGFCIYFFYGVWNSNVRISKLSKNTQTEWRNGDTPKF